MIIPLEDLISIPIYEHGHWQYCKYETSNDESTFPIVEITWFPNPFDFKNYIKVHYEVFYKEVDRDDVELTDTILGMTKIVIACEPNWNEETKSYDKFSSFVRFDDIEQAYNYAISKEIK